MKWKGDLQHQINKIFTLFGKRSFVCRISWGGQSSLHVQTTLSVFLCCATAGAFECMFWEILQKLPELQNTEHVAADGILWSGCSHEDGQLQSDNNCQVGLYFSLCWYLCKFFCLWISGEGVLLVQYVSCTMCIFLRYTGKHDMLLDRNQILCDGTCLDHIVHLTCMVDGLQLQYWHSFPIYDISQTIQHRYRWYFYYIFLNISVIVNFNFHSFYMLWLSYRYRS